MNRASHAPRRRPPAAPPQPTSKEESRLLGLELGRRFAAGAINTNQQPAPGESQPLNAAHVLYSIISNSWASGFMRALEMAEEVFSHRKKCP